jgi:hypothetical protein
MNVKLIELQLISLPDYLQITTNKYTVDTADVSIMSVAKVKFLLYIFTYAFLPSQIIDIIYFPDYCRLSASRSELTPKRELSRSAVFYI